PEGGGQVGDTGKIVGQKTGEEIEIVDSFKENELIIHVSKNLPQDPGQIFDAVVENTRREKSAAHHTATHLLHAALRKVLGHHVTQRGSLVNPEYLRFDFSHFAKMSNEEIAQVEQIVNEHIRKNTNICEDRDIAFNEAVRRGAMALFGEKYGDKVRMITFDPAFSIELCGGTHAPSTGTRGFFKIVSESAAAAGIRRIQAVAGEAAERFVNERLNELDEAKILLKNPKSLPAAIESLRENNRSLQNELESSMYASVLGLKNDLLSNAESLGPVNWVGARIDADDQNAVRRLISELNGSLKNAIILLGSGGNEKANLWLSIAPEAAQKFGLNAGSLIGDIAKAINGGGGGQVCFATAGGKNPGGLSDALTKGRTLIEELVSKAAENN
ncbi:MAG: DHHA1 domain-containing protein, partial [Bacteroidota bacterium]|nr:DHHA1 domain-containing protein [Bacteroidota bacterium]